MAYAVHREIMNLFSKSFGLSHLNCDIKLIYIYIYKFSAQKMILDVFWATLLIDILSMCVLTNLSQVVSPSKFSVSAPWKFQYR